MPKGVNIDGILVTWGDRLFYPGNRAVKSAMPPKLTGSELRQRANFIRNRIEGIVRRAPQVMVKVTGGGRSMRAIAAHFRYISKNGRLDIEDDRGETIQGPRAVRDLADDWRHSGSLIAEDAATGGRREAFNIMLSMPRGTDPLAVQQAARQFARSELAGHKYVMVLHDHQANPHIHISVRAESRLGDRMSPRKRDLLRWRDVFAEKLRALGIEAEASRRATRGSSARSVPLWMAKGLGDGRHRGPIGGALHKEARGRTGSDALTAWVQVRRALNVSEKADDQRLGRAIMSLLQSWGAKGLVTPEVSGWASSASPSWRQSGGPFR